MSTTKPHMRGYLENGGQEIEFGSLELDMVRVIRPSHISRWTVQETIDGGGREDDVVGPWVVSRLVSSGR